MDAAHVQNGFIWELFGQLGPGGLSADRWKSMAFSLSEPPPKPLGVHSIWGGSGGWLITWIDLFGFVRALHRGKIR